MDGLIKLLKLHFVDAHFQLYPPVGRPAFQGAVIRYGLFLPEAGGSQPGPGDTFRDQVSPDGCRSFL